MRVSDDRQQPCTVVVTVDANVDVLEELLEHAQLGLRRFPECDGFVSGALHISADRTRMIQYLQWESEAAYINCRDDSRWDEFESTRRFADHISAGRATLDARTYSVVAHSG
ncbi:MAG: hypothetical protein ACR2PK_18690 [Acidimicrobiales bacterium]